MENKEITTTAQENSDMAKLNDVFEKHEKSFSKAGNGLHFLLWRIIVAKIYEGRRVGFSLNIDPAGYQLVLAEYAQKGYIETHVYFEPHTKRDEAKIVVDALNAEVFNLTEEQASRIQVSSFAGVDVDKIYNQR